MKKLLIAAALVGVLAAGAGAAVLATSSTVPVTVTVPYTIGGQTGQVAVTKDVIVPVQTVTETVTQTVTAPPTTTTTPPPPPPPTDTTPTTTTPPPPPPSQGTTMTPDQFERAASVNGAVFDNVTVKGSGAVSVLGANVTIRNSHFDGLMIEAFSSATGFQLLDSQVTNGGFNLWGADNVLIQGNLLDGGGHIDANKSWDYPAGNATQNVTIRNNTIQHYHGSSCSVHSEALMIGGYTKDWLVEGNTFIDNGCTSHIFFTYFGTASSGGYSGNSSTLPHNICVRGNDFGPTAGAYVDINFRQEINQAGPSATGIKIDPDQHATTTNTAFNLDC